MKARRQWSFGAARFSEDGKYRYALTRRWGPESSPSLVWCMLNPSKADAGVDDPTVRKCIGFSKTYGFGSLTIVNLYALRSTDPTELLHADVDTVGPENDVHIEHRTFRQTVVVAWGAFVHRLGDDGRARINRVASPLREGADEVLCLGYSVDGHPLHPLMQPYRLQLRPWQG